MRLECLYIDRTTGKGRGIYTTEPILPGTIIEIAPVIVMTNLDRQLLDQTLLHDYIFEWGVDTMQCAMALGWIPIYNHATPSNCEYFMDFEEQTMFLKTTRLLEAGEEVTINYNGDYDNPQPVWFEPEL